MPPKSGRDWVFRRFPWGGGTGSAWWVMAGGRWRWRFRAGSRVVVVAVVIVACRRRRRAREGRNSNVDI